MREFLSEIFIHSSNFVSIKLGYSDKKKIETTALKLLNAKDLNVLRDRYEGVLFYKRFQRQLSSEVAIEKMLDISFIDWDLKAKKRDLPSILEDQNLKVGISSLDFGSYPILIDNEINLPQIFTILKGTDTVLICGYASLDVLQEHRKEIPMTTLLSGKKVAFTGFKFLQRFNNYEDLKLVYEKKA